MKHGTAALGAAILGLAGVVGLDLGGSTLSLVHAASGGGTASKTVTSTSSSRKATSANRSSTGTGARSPSTTTSTIAPGALRSATGPTEQFGYGQLAVRVTVRANHITGLSVVGLQTLESYSQQLAAQVIPTLQNEVLSAQNTQVNGISGATYTGDAYLSSIQSALDALHVK